MRAQRERDTQPELALRAELFRRGLRYRLHRRPLPHLRRTMDLVFPTERVAIDVRGCFWHSCPTHATSPKANAEWWAQKLAANRLRDRDTESQLSAAGWSLVVVWEHEDPVAAAAAIAPLVVSRRK